MYGGIFVCLNLFHRYNVIHAGIYDPSYLGVTDYEKDWEIVAKDVNFMKIAKKSLF
jgi:hypothetical protein